MSCITDDGLIVEDRSEDQLVGLARNILNEADLDPQHDGDCWTLVEMLEEEITPDGERYIIHGETMVDSRQLAHRVCRKAARLEIG